MGTYKDGSSSSKQYSFKQYILLRRIFRDNLMHPVPIKLLEGDLCEKEKQYNTLDVEWVRNQTRIREDDDFHEANHQLKLTSI